MGLRHAFAILTLILLPSVLDRVDLYSWRSHLLTPVVYYVLAGILSFGILVEWCIDVGHQIFRHPEREAAPPAPPTTTVIVHEGTPVTKRGVDTSWKKEEEEEPSTCCCHDT